MVIVDISQQVLALAGNLLASTGMEVIVALSLRRSASVSLCNWIVARKSHSPTSQDPADNVLLDSGH
jgi:hypothetical protein